MRARSLSPAVLFAALLPCASGARAQDVVYGPDGAPTVVQRKLHPMTGRWEASALFDVALNTALVDQSGGLLSLTWHPNEWLDFGAEGLFHRTGLSALAQNVRKDLRARTPLPGRDEITNDNQLRAGAFGVVRVAPLYGKFNLASEVKVHFQGFVLGGAGLAAVHRESINLCAEAGTGPCQIFQANDATRLAGDAGLGFRFYFGQRWSLETQVRGYFFRSSYKLASDPTVPSTGTPHGYLAVVATFDAGLSFLF